MAGSFNSELSTSTAIAKPIVQIKSDGQHENISLKLQNNLTIKQLDQSSTVTAATTDCSSQSNLSSNLDNKEFNHHGSVWTELNEASNGNNKKR